MRQPLFALLSLGLCEGSSSPPVVWSIAGSDSGGGAGIQADLHAIRALDAHPCTVVTASTAQNSREVRRVEYASAAMVSETIATLEDDLYPGAVKLGMMGREDLIREVGSFLDRYKGPVVCDPVMVSTSGARLLDERAMGALQRLVFPRCTLVTPNLQEAEALLGSKVSELIVALSCPPALLLFPSAVLPISRYPPSRRSFSPCLLLLCSPAPLRFF